MKKVVVVAPTYNEKNSIEKLTRLVLDQNGKLPGFDIHVLVVDSHSPDGTGEIVQRLVKENNKVHFLDIHERGLGRAIIKGYEYAMEELKADVLMQIDADLQHDPNEIPLFLQKIEEGYEYIQGSRYVKGGENNISITRQIFSFGASFACRLLTGIWKIRDFTPSYKAYTRQLYERIDKSHIPWQGTTFLIQPAAVVEAFRAGAKTCEVPIKFQNRRADKSKNEVANYVIDILGYGLEVRLSNWGIKLPVLFWVRRSKTFIKFGMVGLIGTFVDFAIYKILIRNIGFVPPNAKLVSTIIAIQTNFTLNNGWTFRNRKTKNKLWQRLFLYNLVSSGGIFISYGIVYSLHGLYGDGQVHFGNIGLAYNNFFFFATIPPVMIWNFFMNHFVTWRHERD